MAIAIDTEEIVVVRDVVILGQQRRSPVAEDVCRFLETILPAFGSAYSICFAMRIAGLCTMFSVPELSTTQLWHKCYRIDTRASETQEQHM